MSRREYKGRKVKLYQWRPGFLSAGHLALRISYDGNPLNEVSNKDEKEIYVSYWPQEQKCSMKLCCCSVPADFHHYQQDCETYQGHYSDPSYNGAPHYRHDITDIVDPRTIHDIIETFKAIRERPPGKNKWFIFGESCTHLSSSHEYHCSFLIWHLLKKSNIEQHLPFGNQFSNTRHVIALSASRIFIAVGFLVAGIYPIIQAVEESDGEVSEGMLILLLNQIPLFFLERYFDSPRLIEMSNSDCLVGIGLSFGLGFGFMVYYTLVFPEIESSPTGERIVFEILALFFSVLVSFGFGKIASLLVQLFGNAGYVNTPSSVVHWINYIKKTQHIPVQMKKLIFIKELAFILTLPISWGVIYGIWKKNERKFDHWREQSLYVGLLPGLFTAYEIIHFIIFRINKKLEKIVELEGSYNFERTISEEVQAIDKRNTIFLKENKDQKQNIEPITAFWLQSSQFRDQALSLELSEKILNHWNRQESNLPNCNFSQEICQRIIEHCHLSGLEKEMKTEMKEIIKANDRSLGKYILACAGVGYGLLLTMDYTNTESNIKPSSLKGVFTVSGTVIGFLLAIFVHVILKAFGVDLDTLHNHLYNCLSVCHMDVYSKVSKNRYRISTNPISEEREKVDDHKIELL